LKNLRIKKGEIPLAEVLAQMRSLKEEYIRKVRAEWPYINDSTKT